jgi:CheY-like chemotaxis protein
VAQKILVKREYEKDLTVFGAESDVRQAILNLLVNAGDAMPEGGDLNIQTSGSEQEVLIAVKDTGIGMAPETLVQCRSVFFSTKGKRGSGLGLPMVSNTAFRHGGRVEVESNLGMGSAFHLYLSRDSSNIQIDVGGAPETLDSADESRWSNSPQDASPSAGSELGTQRRLLKSDQIESLLMATEEYLSRQIRMLVVDDDPGASGALIHLGEKLGVECHVRDNGEDGLVFLKDNLVDVVIADVDMPNLRGDEFAVLVRESFKDLTILLFTGRPESVNARGKEVSDHVLAKPMEAREVLLVSMVTLAERLGVDSNYE